ncbi:MAG: hypothetical protein ACPHYF_08890, partial [Akkermansiaceae bacterium]
MKPITELRLPGIGAIATVSIFFASCGENQAEAQGQAAEAAAPKPREMKLDDVDEEQMRLVKVIRERILKQAEKEASTAEGEAVTYTEELDTGASFEMLPVKGGSFRWQGEQADDVIEATISPFWMGKHEV